VDEVLRIDASGRELVVTDLRRRPARAGTYQHTIEDGDRLDHLGQRYYRRPDRWWEICDANPEVLSPLRLLGQEPLRTLRIAVPAKNPVPPWPAVLADLRARPGVEQVGFDLGQLPGPAGMIAVGVITVEFNELSLSVTALADAVAAHGLDPVTSLSPEPVGGQIVIPPPGSRS
jgi:hypothetical protein